MENNNRYGKCLNLLDSPAAGLNLKMLLPALLELMALFSGEASSTLTKSTTQS